MQDQKIKQHYLNKYKKYCFITFKIKILENRLDKANQKFNEAIATNKNLR